MTFNWFQMLFMYIYIDNLHLIYTVAKSCLSNKLFIAEILYIERLTGTFHLEINQN